MRCRPTHPTVNFYPDFDDNLRQAFRREIELFFDSIVHEDRSILDLLTADYTFVNERLAKHYGIPNVYGPQFRRVHARAGSRHAPRPARQGRAADGDVAAGAHVAGVARQVVPADLPRREPAGSAAERAGDQAEDEGRRSRQRERADDARSRWISITRIRSARRATGSSSRSAWRWRISTRSARGGPRMTGRRSTRRACWWTAPRWTAWPACATCWCSYQAQFVRVVTEKLLTYALGRGVEYPDMPLVRSIVRDAAKDNYRFSSLVLGIVKSAPFQMNTKGSEATQQAARLRVSSEETAECLSPRSTFPAGPSCAAPA